MSHFQAGRVRSRVMNWGRAHYHSYPWREVDDLWLGMLSEILLQRTNARHVELHFPEMAALFPTPQSVLESTASELSLIEGRFGLDRRLRTVVDVATYMRDHSDARYDRKSLTSIFGVGDYTASAFLSLHVGIRAVLVDSNIARWLGRMTGLPVPVNLRHCKWVRELVEELTPKRIFKEYNYAVLDFTIWVCKSKSPRCSACPLANHCSFAENTEGKIAKLK